MYYAYIFINMFMWSDRTLHMYVLCYTSPAGRVHMFSGLCYQKVGDGPLWRELPIPSYSQVHVSFQIRKLMCLHRKATFSSQSLLVRMLII